MVAAAPAKVHDAGARNNHIASNIILDKDSKDGRCSIRLIDFGCALLTHSVGSDDAVDIANGDLYTFGLIFCEVLVSEPITNTIQDIVNIQTGLSCSTCGTAQKA